MTDPCNCPQALAQKAKLRRLGLKLALQYLRTIEPLRGEYGRGGHAPGDAHKRWAERFNRVRALLAACGCLLLFACGGRAEQDRGITAVCWTQCAKLECGARECRTFTSPEELDDVAWWARVTEFEEGYSCLASE